MSLSIPSGWPNVFELSLTTTSNPETLNFQPLGKMEGGGGRDQDPERGEMAWPTGEGPLPHGLLGMAAVFTCETCPASVHSGT